MAERISYGLDFGLDKVVGLMRTVDEAPQGKECGCGCVERGASLVARQGKRSSHHLGS